MPSLDDNLSTVLNSIDQAMPAARDRLVSLLRIPSISTDEDHREDCEKAAVHLAGALKELGFITSVEKTASHPVVFAQRLETGAPHVLFYGHYDVQPIDPADKWDKTENWGPDSSISQHPAFNPRFKTVEGSERVIARGASDDKGQLMTFVEACRSLIEVNGKLPVSVTIVIEGAEEASSKGFSEWIEANVDRLRADIGLVCDTGMWDRDTPWITTSLRGLAYFEVTVTLGENELHSGIYGGSVPNPNVVIADVISGLHDADHRVTLPGFYDGVPEISPELRHKWEKLDAEAIEKLLKPVGGQIPIGERGRMFIEMIQSRPSCDVNGIKGGYAERGKTKTSIPPSACAHISFRLVGDQDPDLIAKTFETYVHGCVPEGCTAEVISQPGSRGFVVPTDMSQLAAARLALRDEWGKDPVELGLGGSIPAVGEFKRILGLDTLLIGFALADDAIHAPNEKYEMRSFHKGTRSWARILTALGKGAQA